MERAIRAIGVPELLVLHCRGMKDKDNSEAYDLLCQSLQHCVGQGVLIHLHCFNGKPKVVKKWLEAFPNTYFGFTKMVGDFTGEYARAVQELHESRLLIETDAPYFHVNQNRHSTPAVIGMAAREMARIRGSD